MSDPAIRAHRDRSRTGPGRVASAGTVMLALGDSIAAGIGAPHVSEGCMALVAEALAHHSPGGVTLLNLAVPGESSASMLAPGGQLDRAEAALAEALAAGASVGPVTLSIGANDAMEAAVLGDDEALRRLDANLGVILRRLGAALAAVGETAAAASLCVQTFYNPFDGDAAVDPDQMAPRRAQRPGFNKVIRGAAQHAGVRLADVAHRFRGRAHELTWVRSGDIHPNAEGHRVIAAVVLTALGVVGATTA